eukprot:TRINITY_DN5724_c0_g1_i3.p1 TRINITY_DN5724_c0_g1~~TRINITY_DN5724_c0_g1_i3.p1  ORF type:complete len:399 (-),score=83.01 TRINITY_DN5724_c0_g1_i3:4-1200(-)
MLKTEDIRYTRDIDVTNYVNGKRVTLNPAPLSTNDDGTPKEYAPADGKWIWNKFNGEGVSLRLKCPQEFSPPLHKMMFILEELWGAGVSANVYLTPKSHQGFAPHYDDVEVFILQVEGSKRWRLYPHRDASEHLDRTSSPNFDQADIGSPFLDVVLKSGDLLCLPRGCIHQAISTDEHHSLHITVSTGWRNSLSDYLKLVIPRAIDRATKSNLEFRQSIPQDLFSFFPPKTEEDKAKVKAFEEIVASAMIKVAQNIDTQEAVSAAAKNFLHCRLPFPEPELLNKDKNIDGITLATKFRLARRDIARLVEEKETNTLALYFCVNNSIHFQEKLPQYLEVDLIFQQALELVFSSYPEFISVGELPVIEYSESEDSEEVEEGSDNIELVKALARAGILEIQ